MSTESRHVGFDLDSDAHAVYLQTAADKTGVDIETFARNAANKAACLTHASESAVRYRIPDYTLTRILGLLGPLEAQIVDVNLAGDPNYSGCVELLLRMPQAPADAAELDLIYELGDHGPTGVREAVWRDADYSATVTVLPEPTPVAWAKVPQQTPPVAPVVKIIEPRRRTTDRDDTINPFVVYLDGRLMPTDGGPVTVHTAKNDLAKVTLTLLARKVTVAAEGDLTIAEDLADEA